MKLSESEVAAILGAVGITETLQPAQAQDVSRRIINAENVVARVEEAMRKHFLFQALKEMPQIEREALANRVYPRRVFKPSRWEVIPAGASFKPAIRFSCPMCTAQEILYCPNIVESNWRGRTWRNSLQSVMRGFRDYRWSHCGKTETIPEAILEKFEQMAQPHLPSGSDVSIPVNM